MEYSVLIVDDSQLIVDRLKELIRDQACINTVNAANSYSEALSLLALHTYQVAILDINIPGKNGIELLTFLKENYPEIKTIMLTNQSDSYYRDLCMKLGTDEYVDKSNDFEKIPTILHTYFTEYSKQ